MFARTHVLPLDAVPFRPRLAGGVRRRGAGGRVGPGCRRRGGFPSAGGRFRLGDHHPAVPEHQRRPGRRLGRSRHRRDARRRSRGAPVAVAETLAGARRPSAARRSGPAHRRASGREDRARGVRHDGGRNDVRSVRRSGRVERPSDPRRRVAGAARAVTGSRWSVCAGGVRRRVGKRRVRDGPRDHPRAASAARTGGHRPRRGGPRHHAGDSSRWSAATRRATRRARLPHRAAGDRLHSAGAGRRRAGPRSDRGLGAVRSGHPVRRRALLERRSGPHHRQRDEARQLQHVRQRDLLGGARHLLRPAERLQLHHQRAGRAVRRHHHERADPQPRLERGVGRPGRPLRAGLDPRDGHSLQVAALPDRSVADLGHQLPTQRRLDQRAVVPDTDSGRALLPGHVPVLLGRHSRRRRGAPVRHAARAQAVCHLRRDDRRQCHTPVVERSER